MEQFVQDGIKVKEIYKMWSSLKKVLGFLTDVLSLGRAAGWWNKTNTIPTGNNSSTLNAPTERKKK